MLADEYCLLAVRRRVPGASRRASPRPSRAQMDAPSALTARAPTAVMAYLIAEQRLSYADARRLVVAGRPCARPNPGFVAQLQQYEAAVHGRAAANPG